MDRMIWKLFRLFAATLLCVSSIDTAVSQPGRPRIDLDALAARGEVLANQDPLAVELRNQQAEGPARRGFDIGMGAAEGQTAPGPGKQRIHDVLLSPDEQPGYRMAVSFSLERNRYAERATRGAAIAEADAEIANARNSKTDVFYKLGFDIASAIYGDPALGAQGNTSMGPGARGIRDSLSPSGQWGFNESMNLNLSRRGISISGPTLPVSSNRIKVGPKIGNTTPPPDDPEYRELRCRGRYGMSIRVGDWYPSSAGEPMKQMIVIFNLIDKPTNNWGLHLRPGDCAYVDTPGKVLGVSELHQVIVAFGQLKQKLNGSYVDTSPTAAERFPDAQNVPQYLQDSNHYWSFFVKYSGRGYFEVSYGKFWKPAPPLRESDKVKISQP
jgi:hypothetical protein